MKDRSGPFSTLHTLITTIIVNRRISTSRIRVDKLYGLNIIVVKEE
jgi:hypothetical protein